jgi:hypothetical protein
MKVCPNCQNKYPDDGNFCPRESCATADGPCRLVAVVEEAAQRFTPTARLGGSLSGEVWEARDNQTGATVAYKLVATQSLPSPVAVDRAQRELKQMLRAQSPRIAKVIDYGKAADGRVFVATELCAGEPLDALVEKSGPMALARAKRIIAQIGEALLEGQKVGVTHHDLAPKNVLVDGDDQIKVINFTIPRPNGDSKVFGVPAFLSPEQSEGKLGDQRSNTYSLGALTAFLLTGAPPFSGPDAAAVLEQVIRGEVQAPSKRRAELTPEIDRPIVKAMDKSSSRRQLTMRQFLTEVAAMQIGGAPAPARAAGIGLNKTLMYAGGAPEVQRLVAEATAARAEANGSGPAVAYSPVPAGSGSPAAAAQSHHAAHAMDQGLTPGPAALSTPAPIALPVAAVARVAPAPAAMPDPAAQLTPPPAAAAQRAHGAAIAATMVAMPSAPPALGVPMAPIAALPGARVAAAAGVDPRLQPTPPPVATDEAPQSRRGSAAQGAGGNFRETLWFKKGDVEQMVADAKAKTAGAAAGNAGHNDHGHDHPVAPAELPAEGEDGKPLEDRYLDDGSVTHEDRNKFSLRRGGTSASVPVVADDRMSGDRMSESEMLNEIGGGKRIKIIAIAAVVVAVVVAVLVVSLKGKGPDKAPLAPPPAVTRTEEPPAPPPAAKTTTAEAPGAAPTAPAGDDGEPAQAKETPPSRAAAPATTRARSAKKKPAKHAAGKKKH